MLDRGRRGSPECQGASNLRPGKLLTPEKWQSNNATNQREKQRFLIRPTVTLDGTILWKVTFETGTNPQTSIKGASAKKFLSHSTSFLRPFLTMKNKCSWVDAQNRHEKAEFLVPSTATYLDSLPKLPFGSRGKKMRICRNKELSVGSSIIRPIHGRKPSFSDAEVRKFQSCCNLVTARFNVLPCQYNGIISEHQEENCSIDRCMPWVSL